MRNIFSFRNVPVPLLSEGQWGTFIIWMFRIRWGNFRRSVVPRVTSLSTFNLCLSSGWRRILTSCQGTSRSLSALTTHETSFLDCNPRWLLPNRELLALWLFNKKNTNYIKPIECVYLTSHSYGYCHVLSLDFLVLWRWNNHFKILKWTFVTWPLPNDMYKSGHYFHIKICSYKDN